MNPVRAQLVTPRTAGETPLPAWLTPEWVLGQFGVRQQQAQARYRQFVAEGRDGPRPWDQITGQIYLGSEAWVQIRLVDIVPTSDTLRDG